MALPHKPIPYPFPSPPSLYAPAPEYLRLLESAPVVPVTLPDGTSAWLATGHAEVRQVLTDPRFSRAAVASGQNAPEIGLDVPDESLLGMDPPEHTRLRRLVARAFTVRRVEELRPRVAKLVDELIDGMAMLPRPVDLVEHFSLPLPIQVICELLGVPTDDRRLFRAWSDAVLTTREHEPSASGAAFDELSRYFAELIAAKRAGPADDLMTALVEARDAHDRLSERELVTLGITLLVAGHETTANQINMSLLTLLHHPDQMARLRADAAAIPRAVEELMRFVQLGQAGAGIVRVTTEDLELGGVPLPAGTAVLPALAAANRDRDVFERPDRLDVSRTHNPHLGFGAGAHHCLGAQLARMELQEALSGLLRRMPGLRVTVPDSELRFKPGMVVRSVESLPVTW